LTIQELFIANLKAYRKLRKISQMQLAELCNSSAGYIGEIESGKCFPSVRMIERIAFGLEIESWHLFKNGPISHLDNTSSSPYAELAPSQKKEIMKRANSALAKILDDF
jgi:transcriptional regulator with XRE-family HTH domain